jgi:voltage-gated potassium channel
VTWWRRVVRLTAGVAAAVCLYFAVPLSTTTDRTALLRVVLCVVAIGLLAALVMWQMRLELEDADHRVDGLLMALVVSILGFALTFYLLGTRDPGQVAGLHTRLDSLYFTMSTTMTIGYGDVHATGQAARALTMVQMLFNVVVIATAAATLNARVRTVAAARAQARRRERETT